MKTMLRGTTPLRVQRARLTVSADGAVARRPFASSRARRDREPPRPASRRRRAFLAQFVHGCGLRGARRRTGVDVITCYMLTETGN